MSKARAHSVNVVEEEEESFLELPVDGYRFKLVDIEGYSSPDPVVDVSINVANLDRAFDFYHNVLKAKVVDGVKTLSNGNRMTLLGYNDHLAKLELVERADKKVCCKRLLPSIYQL